MLMYLYLNENSNKLFQNYKNVHSKNISHLSFFLNRLLKGIVDLKTFLIQTQLTY